MSLTALVKSYHLAYVQRTSGAHLVAESGNMRDFKWSLSTQSKPRMLKNSLMQQIATFNACPALTAPANHIMSLMQFAAFS